MAELGGFLAVSYLAERVFQDALEALWRTRWEEATGEAQWGADTAFGRLEAGGGFSLDKPSMVFRGGANAVEIRLAGACRSEITLAGTALGGAVITFDAVVMMPVTVTQETIYDKAVVDLSRFTLEPGQLRITWLDGAHDANGEAAVLGTEAREALAQEVRTRAARFVTYHFPMSQTRVTELLVMTQGVPGSIVYTPMVKLGNVRILDGWLALGIDATSGIAMTQGDAAAIGPPPAAPPPGPAPMPQAAPGAGTMRLLVDPAVAVAYLQANAKLAVRMAAAMRPNLHPDRDSIRVELQDDCIVLTANGSVDAPDPFPGTMPFTANVRIRPFIPVNARALYASVKPDVRVDAPWYLDVLGAIVDFFGGDAFAQLNRVNKSAMPVLFSVVLRDVPFPGADDVLASVEAHQLVLRPDLFAIYGEATVKTKYTEQEPSPTPSVVSAIRIRERLLQLRFTGLRLCDDPTFLVRYSLSRGSDGAVLTSGTTWSGTAQPFGATVDMWDPANVLETEYIAELVAERPPGNEVARVREPVKVLDPFDRSHPFVRWRKQHYYSGSRQPIPILSAVHRTAIPGRCKFCDFRGGRFFDAPYVYQALDTLPAPEEAGFSTRLCGYCFPDG